MGGSAQFIFSVFMLGGLCWGLLQHQVFWVSGKALVAPFAVLFTTRSAVLCHKTLVI